jgi:hypothetical protein
MYVCVCACVRACVYVSGHLCLCVCVSVCLCRASKVGKRIETMTSEGKTKCCSAGHHLIESFRPLQFYDEAEAKKYAQRYPR